MARRRNPSPADYLRALQDTMREVPGSLEALASAAVGIREAHQMYRETHWGRRGVSPAMLSSVANPHTGVVELGSLVEIAYLTEKGRDKQPTVYQHKFSRPFPILGYAADGSGLVIARARSEYDITARGIEG